MCFYGRGFSMTVFTIRYNIKKNLKRWDGGTRCLETAGHILPTVTDVWSCKYKRNHLGWNFHNGVLRVQWHRSTIRPTFRKKYNSGAKRVLIKAEWIILCTHTWTDVLNL